MDIKVEWPRFKVHWLEHVIMENLSVQWNVFGIGCNLFPNINANTDQISSCLPSYWCWCIRLYRKKPLFINAWVSKESMEHEDLYFVVRWHLFSISHKWKHLKVETVHDSTLQSGKRWEASRFKGDVLLYIVTSSTKSFNC